MRRFVVALVTAAVLFTPSIVQAQESEQDRLERLEDALRDQQRRMTEQERTIQELRDKLRAEEAGVDREALAEEVKSYLQDRADLTDGFWSRRGEHLRVFGEIELEYLSQQGDPNPAPDGRTPAPNPSQNDFQLDKFVLGAEVPYSDSVRLWVELEVAANGAGKNARGNFNQAYFQVDSILDHLGLTDSDPFNHQLTVGLQNRWEKPSRGTESYPIIGTRFWRDENIRVQVEGTAPDDWSWLSWVASIGNSRELDDRSPFDRGGSWEILHADEFGSDGGSGLEFTLGLQADHSHEDAGDFSFKTWWVHNDLDTGDLVFLNGVVGYPPTGGRVNNRDNDSWGARIDWSHSDDWFIEGNQINARFEGGWGETGEIEQSGWYAQIWYDHHTTGIEVDGRRYWTKISPLYRWDRYIVQDIPAAPTDSATWDVDAHVIGAILQVTRNVKLKLEYTIPEFDTGGSEPDADQFLAQLEVKF